MKIALVGDVHHFSTLDVYEGYKLAFTKLGVDFDCLDYRSLVAPFGNGIVEVKMTEEVAQSLILAKILQKDNGYTHVLFISGLKIARQVLNSMYDKKVGIIALDDPHCSLPLLENLDYMDWYFTNEKTMHQTNPKIHYVPTATTSILPVNLHKEDMDEQYQSDICFVGTMYPDRIPLLNRIREWCLIKNKKFNCVGPFTIDSKHHNPEFSQSIINGTISNQEAMMYYKGSELVINIDREINWNCLSLDGKNENLFNTGKPAESLNPRAYEVCGCKVPQLFINPRKEATELWGDNVFHCEEALLETYLERIFSTDKKELEKKVSDAYAETVSKHTYYNRASQIINIMEDS